MRIEWITEMRSKRYFVAIVVAAIVVIVSLTLIGVFLLGNGNTVSKSGEITKKDITDQEKVLNEYYEAIDQGKYKDAYNLTSANYRRGRSYDNFVYQYKEYIKSVKIKSMERISQYSDKENGVFNLTFDAIYKQKYPDGNGELPAIHVLQREKKKSPVWKIDSIGIGQVG